MKNEKDWDNFTAQFGRIFDCTCPETDDLICKTRDVVFDALVTDEYCIADFVEAAVKTAKKLKLEGNKEKLFLTLASVLGAVMWCNNKNQTSSPQEETIH